MPTRIALLGSTGSIGRQVLDVVRWFPDRLQIAALTARSDLAGLRAQAAEFQPAYRALSEPLAHEAAEAARLGMESGPESLVQAATHPDADLVVVAVVGTAGLSPALAALESGKNVALATKEALVVGGHLMTPAARASGAAILPIDSEHSAIWQCLRGAGSSEIEKLVLTASGGPFVDWPAGRIARASVSEALNHPTWDMGGKITIDSASLMNKGLEVIEARWLFDVGADRIDVVVHRQSIVHSLVYFRDSSVLAQLGLPDMRLPIQYALLYPDRPANLLDRLDLCRAGSLTFEAPDLERFRCLRLAFDAAAEGGSLPCVMSAANEVAVDLFLSGLVPFGAIPTTIEEVMLRHAPVAAPGLESLLELDQWARQEAEKIAPVRAEATTA